MLEARNSSIALIVLLLASTASAAPAKLGLAFAPMVSDTADPGSFIRFLLFTNTHTSPNGGTVWFTGTGQFDGPVHTNGEFRFGYAPYFGDAVTSANQRAWYYNNGTPKELDDDHNGAIDVPVFAAGFQRGAAPIPLPTLSYRQQNAALGLGEADTPPSNSMINAALGMSGSGPPASGIYLVHDSSNSVNGGLYVQGSLDRCELSVDGSGRQVYTMIQAATTKTVTLDVAANTTTAIVGAKTTTYTGIPLGILYVNGSISDLRGPDRIGATPQPALAVGEARSIVATGDIVIQRDIVIDDLDVNPAVLGVYSAGGSVRIGSSAPNDLQLDTYVMATGVDGIFGVDNYSAGSARGAVHLRGGCVESYFGAFGTFTAGGAIQTGYARDFHFDRRGIVPPYYPRFTPPPAAAPVVRAPSALRLSVPRPNPSHGALQVDYSLPRAGRVRLTLFDVLGRRVANLVDSDQPAGPHGVNWAAGHADVRRLAPGLYLLELNAAGQRANTRVVILD